MDPCYGQGSHRNVCATAGGGTLKFVNAFPCCCCGGDGETGCRRSMHAYTIKTWSMRMSGDMECLKDGTVDATKLWGGDAYKSLPRVMPLYPMVTKHCGESWST
nr:unnamed protein product [Digitaria exilis]